MRIELELDAAQIEAFDRLAESENLFREALILQAIQALLSGRAEDRFSKAFNLWGSVGPDGLEFQQTSRREWQDNA
ncbi:MAG TPA: CopG family transcriptional regulator [Ensifer sp.]|nr:CopG family transcriptional regulator [Ensifer sp.]